MRKIVVGLIVAAVLLASSLYWKGKTIVAEAEHETRWLRINMWNAIYFNPKPAKNLNVDDLFLKSTTASHKDAILKYLKGRTCREYTEECITRQLMLANILITENDLSTARKLENQAAKYYAENTSCAIRFETTFLRHIIAVTRKLSLKESKDRANSILEKIKKQGGVKFNLRTKACESLAASSPQLFHNYVMTVAEIMSYAGGSWAESAAYLRKINSYK